MLDDRAPQLPLFLGCPVWNCPAWSEIVYPARTPQRDWLRWYTLMFNSVEGNSSFYAVPRLEHVRRWAREAATGFQFCMKFPRRISHELGLRNSAAETSEFLAVLDVLAEAGCLGPSFLQLGPDFGPENKKTLRNYLDSLPSELPWAVELRHFGWFDRGRHEAGINAILGERGIDKVLFDSRPLYQAPPEDTSESVSQTRKPRTPVRQTVTGTRPMLRLVGRNRIERVDPYLEQWVPILSKWIQKGLKPVVFTHTPNDQLAPLLARRLWNFLAPHLEHHRDSLPAPPERPKQIDLGFQ